MELWSKLRQGDKSALEAIYRDHIDALVQYGRRFTRDQSVVEDCIHDLFVQLWKRHSHLGNTDSIRNYLMASLRRSIYKLNSPKVKSIDPQEAPDTKDETLNFEQFLIHNEIDEEKKQLLAKALTQISDRQREVIYLKFYQEKSYDEICEIMNINYQSARNMLFKAIRSMKKALALIFFGVFGLQSKLENLYGIIEEMF